MDGHYPKALCESFVKLVADSAVAAGLQLEPLAISTLHAARSAGQVQPRVSKYPPLISEFAHSVTVRAADAPLLDSKSCLRVPWHAVPVGSRLLRTSKIGDPKRPQLPETQPIVASLPAYTFGVYREPCTFLREAKLLRHPFDTCRALPDGLLRVLHFILVQGPVGVMRHRLNVFKLWQRWAAELEPEERQFCETLHPDVKAVLGNKRILLMRKIASSLGWPDVTLWDDLAEGFKLTGSQPRTGVFDPDCKPAVSSESEFWMAASAQRNATWSRVEKAQFQDYAGPLWEITLEEADPAGKRWLHGPLTRDEVDSLFPEGWMPCRRFAVWQGKWRPIDDFSENGVNEASRPKTGCCEWWVAGRGSCSSVETHGQQRSVPSVAWNHTALSVSETSHAFPYSGSAGTVGAYYFSFPRFSRVLPHGFLQSCMQCSNSRQHEHGDGRSGPKSGGWD